MLYMFMCICGGFNCCFFQFLYEAGFGSEQSTIHSGIIGVTQPRRVAVLATAKRVAYELGLRLGKEVGFQVRHDRRIGDSCSIKFMTDGILLRELQVKCLILLPFQRLFGSTSSIPLALLDIRVAF